MAEDPETWLARRERMKAKGINGNGMGMPLGIAVQLWPTPRAREAGDWQRDNKGNRLKRLTLTGAARMFPTPTAVAGKQSGRMDEWGGSHSRSKLRQMLPPEELNGQLNPTWVEWLMGFPLGWTDLEDSGTP